MKLFRKITIGLCALVAAICIMSVIPVKAEAATKYYITTKAATLTKKAKAKSEKVVSVPSGSVVVVKSTKNKKFYQVTYKKDKSYTGYIPVGSIKKASTYKTDAKTPMYKKKSTSSKKVTTVSKGATVYVLSKSGSWRKVTYFAGDGDVYTGYIKQKTISKASSGTTYKTTNTVNMREGASEEADVIMRVPRGAKVTVTDNSNKYWARVSYTAKKKTQVGYISKRFLTK